MVHAANVGGFKDLVIEAFRFRSSDARASWNGVERDSDGVCMGAFTVDGEATRLVEAWDQSASGADPQRLRFHRQLEDRDPFGT